MEALKFELYSPCATFKTPFSLKGIETYPLPTYSTIIGLIYTALGEKWDGKEFGVSVQGDHESLFRDYIRLRKYNKKDKKLEVLPLEIPRLYNLRCVIHVIADGETLVKFKKALENPSVFLSLGGGEYPVLVKNPRILKIEEGYCEGELRNSAYVPEKLKECIYGEGIYFRLPSFYKIQNGERVWSWEGVYYFPRRTFFEGNLWADEEGEIVWV
ncbi:type I-B CRISPR-associated protein Cas5b [Hydrogenivirga sp.]